MSERDLSTMLGDHLDHEPPVGVTSADAIRTARRGGPRRVAAAGVGALAVLGLGVAVLPGLVEGDGPSAAKDVPAATQAGVPVPGTLEALAAGKVAPYVGALGAPTWDVLDVHGDPRDAVEPDAQYFQVGYAPAGSEIVQLHTGGFAPPEWELYSFDTTCEASLAAGRAVSCEQEELPDGSLLISSVAPYTGVTNTTKRLTTVAEAVADPTDVLWARSVSISTRDGVAAGVSEFVAAGSAEAAEWRIPVAVLREIATDPDLLDPASVAHAPVDPVTEE